MDQGRQFASHAVTEVLEDHEVKISMDGKGGGTGTASASSGSGAT